MSKGRRFSTSERIALYLLADGKCEACGVELEPGWHCDHVVPWVKGGRTDIENGAALCPTCNLKKGDKVKNVLRPWQRDALDEMSKTDNDFMLAACPGSGKTRFALAVASMMVEQQRSATRVIVVVPTRHLVVQFIQDAREFGLKLVDADNGRRQAREPSGYHGIVTTYSSVHTAPALYSRQSSGALVILDEVHHVGDSKGWGTSVLRAFGNARRRLLMTGTPFRSDNVAIPFCRYDSNGDLVVDYAYTFRDAWAEPDFQRPIRFVNFHKIDTTSTWMDKDDVYQSALLSAVDAEREGAALANAVRVGEPWWVETFTRANAVLQSKRLVVPDAAGLVIVEDQQAAQDAAEFIRKATGIEPALVISYLPDSQERLSAFKSGTAPWVVSVRMVSEGVNIPRFEVLLYATNILQALFFQQATARPIRRRGVFDDQTADVFVPMCPTLMRHVAEIEEMHRHALSDAEEIRRRESGSGDAPRRLRVDLGNENARYMGADQHDGAHAPAQAIDLLTSELPSDLKQHAVRFAVVANRIGLLQSSDGEMGRGEDVVFDREKFEQKCEHLARKVDHEWRRNPGDTNRQMFREFGGSRKSLSDEALRLQRDRLLQLLSEGR